jgi:hypothetical protein
VGVHAGLDTVSLEVPEDTGELPAISAEEFGSLRDPTVDPALIRPVVGDRVEAVAYEPVLSSEQVESLGRDAALLDYGYGVFALAPDGDEDETYRLYVDGSRTRIYLLPAGWEPDR